ncbi:MAG: hypothetical protein A3C88_00950 [Candidatus Yanofskybacteria bacterium RIFCSPHIGHO2_02_FULL_50_12]|uniref:Uncharacterized protein n=1 Tax=Candidatus Yanofskybacteria bacterium RIFCSPHIGHO2_02_FULL_50_12 TaxID=1802685 RepID=A0A1F8FY88_9BACT|nr:MAG: hypothetical protein A3C88_00950 [Candidatus Yanofskybacteria bacterium RIFCSPHIGHO2_02_FULL_50_12]
MDPLPQTPTPLPDPPAGGPAPHKPFAKKFLIWVVSILIVAGAVLGFWWSNSLITVEGGTLDNINGFERQEGFDVAYVWDVPVPGLRVGDELLVERQSEGEVVFSKCTYTDHPSIEEFFCQASWPARFDEYSQKEEVSFSKRISLVEFVKGRRPSNPNLTIDPTSKVNSFASCVAEGNPVMESAPERCRSKEGLVFVKYDLCTQVITSARNPQTGETREFPTPCDVPEGWVKI